MLNVCQKKYKQLLQRLWVQQLHTCKVYSRKITTLLVLTIIIISLLNLKEGLYLFDRIKPLRNIIEALAKSNNKENRKKKLKTQPGFEPRPSRCYLRALASARGPFTITKQNEIKTIK